MNVLAVTLARGGSKGIPGKNIKPLNGKPLLAYTVLEALSSRLIDHYVVSTDSEEIASTARALGAQVPFLRPSGLASDTASSADALAHAVEESERLFGKKFDYVIELMVTNPFKTVEDIDSCIELLQSSGADSVVAVKRVEEHHPARLKKIEEGRIVNFCTQEVLESRRQDLKPEAYIRCGAIYALRRDELMLHKRRYGSENSLAYELAFKDSVNIDSEIDWIVAEHLMSRGIAR
jgi:CMP-N,N'-diacetyllegionaminic acid synthase